ncbi:hypothetical protein V8F20_009353 [Naviculisporaceae sp. PSN 640]
MGFGSCGCSRPTKGQTLTGAPAHCSLWPGATRTLKMRLCSCQGSYGARCNRGSKRGNGQLTTPIDTEENGILANLADTASNLIIICGIFSAAFRFVGRLGFNLQPNFRSRSSGPGAGWMSALGHIEFPVPQPLFVAFIRSLEGVGSSKLAGNHDSSSKSSTHRMRINLRLPTHFGGPVKASRLYVYSGTIVVWTFAQLGLDFSEFRVHNICLFVTQRIRCRLRPSSR